MATSLTLLKNQILENDASDGMNSKFTAVRHGKIRYHPCSFSFFKGAQKNEYFMVVDSKQSTVTINIDNVDQFHEDPDTKRLLLVYHIGDEQGKLQKKKDEFECAEVELLLKTFSGIRNKTVGLGLYEDFTTVKPGQAMERSSTMVVTKRDPVNLIEEEENKRERSNSGND